MKTTACLFCSPCKIRCELTDDQLYLMQLCKSDTFVSYLLIVLAESQETVLSVCFIYMFYFDVLKYRKGLRSLVVRE